MSGEKARTAQRGRPRDETIDEAILAATIEVVAERGLPGASVDEIAARARAGKDTIYRRWPHKSELMHAALARYRDAALEAPDTGSLEADLVGYLHSLVGLLFRTPFGPVAAALSAEGRREDGPSWTAEFWERRRAVVTAIVARASERGEQPALAAHLLPDVLLGPLHYRWLSGGQPPDDRYVRELVRELVC